MLWPAAGGNLPPRWETANGLEHTSMLRSQLPAAGLLDAMAALPSSRAVRGQGPKP